MKKLLLLAVTVTAAASLTACGGNMGEMEDFLEVLTGSNEEVARNYTLATEGYGYDNIVVDGDNVQFWNNNSSSYRLQTGEKTESGYYNYYTSLVSNETIDWGTSTSSYSTYYAEYAVETLLTFGSTVLTIEDFAKDGDVFYYTVGGVIESADLASLTFEFTEDEDKNQVVTVTYGSYEYVFTNIGTSSVDVSSLATTTPDAGTDA